MWLGVVKAIKVVNPVLSNKLLPPYWRSREKRGGELRGKLFLANGVLTVTRNFKYMSQFITRILEALVSAQTFACVRQS